jgi:hypothetical protein
LSWAVSGTGKVSRHQRRFFDRDTCRLVGCVRKKLFRKHCLDREYLAVESGTPATQVLLANEFQIVFTTGARATTANRR